MRLRITVPASCGRAVVRYSFLAGAIVCLGLYGYTNIERMLYQGYESRQFDRTLQRAETVPISRVGISSRKAVPPSSLQVSPSIIGRLSVPRVHLSAMVREGVGRKTLQLAIGHIPATALPGQPGNIGLAGHRDTFFRGLRNLRIRDEIQFATSAGDFKYEVVSLLVVDPNDVGVLAPSGEKVLTLVTCYPFTYVGTAPKRFVVRAEQVSPQTVPPPTVK